MIYQLKRKKGIIIFDCLLVWMLIYIIFKYYTYSFPYYYSYSYPYSYSFYFREQNEEVLIELLENTCNRLQQASV